MALRVYFLSILCPVMSYPELAVFTLFKCFKARCERSDRTKHAKRTKRTKETQLNLIRNKAYNYRHEELVSFGQQHVAGISWRKWRDVQVT